MTSRLERLFVLLESGSTPATRKAAANQLGEVQKSHPQELVTLLRKILKYLYSNNWDTRVAAAQAVEAVLKNVPVWKPGTTKESEDGGNCKKEPEVERKLTLETFDIRKLLQTGEFLMSSEGKEFDVEKEGVGQISLQREQLNKQFGFDKLGLKSEQFIDDEDLREATVSPVEKKKSASEILAEEIKSVTGEGALSARELNRLKRKAKQDAKASRKAEEEAENEPKKMKVERAAEGESLLGGEESCGGGGGGQWVLGSLYDQLVSDLLSPSWERRHGAALGLRELLKQHGQSGGRQGGEGEEGGEEAHQAWLEDLLVRLLTVMALDRFGDFVGDSVVCPVRESVGQVIGVVLDSVRPETVLLISEVLGVMMESEEWHTRHAAMLTTKYLLGVRSELGSRLVSSLYPSVVRGLTDSNDDVVAVAATSLLPVCPVLSSCLAREVPGLAEILWEHSSHCDEITSSTQSILSLLSQLLLQPAGVESCGGPGLASLVPRLYPALSHNSSQVRRATLSCLLTLASSAGSEAWLAACCDQLLASLYSRALLEHHQANLSLLLSVWSQVCHQTPLQPLLLATCPQFSHWLQLLSTPPTTPLHLPPLTTPQYLGGPEAQPLTDPLEKERAVWTARDTAARMLGKLSSFIVEPLPDIVYTDVMETPLQMFLGKVLIPQLNTNSAYKKLGVALLVLHWLDQAPPPAQLTTSSLPAVLLSGLSSKQSYSEISGQLSKLRSEAGDYISSLRYFKMDVDISPSSLPTLDLEALQHLVGPLTDNLLAQTKLKQKMLETVQQRRQSLVSSLEATLEDHNNLQLLILSSLAGAVAFMGAEALPEKLNPVIKPLMEAVKKQSSEAIQRTAARSLVRVLNSCVSRQSSPNEKVIKNLCAFVCSNPETTPLVTMSHIQGQVSPTDGILTLHYNERNAEKMSSKARKGKKVSLGGKVSGGSSAPLQTTTDIDNEEDLVKVEIQRRGARLVLLELATYFGPSLPEKMPKLWEICYLSVSEFGGEEMVERGEGDWQGLVNSLSVLSVITPSLSPHLHQSLLLLLPTLFSLTAHRLTAVRYMAAVALTQVARELTVEVMTGVVELLVPRLDPASELSVRQGVVETVFCVTEELGLAVVPYIVLLVVPVLGAMSDSDSKVRLLATTTFASLVRLMPLDGGVPEPENLSADLRRRKEEEKEFLSQLLDSKTAVQFRVSVPVQAELRSYQVAGVNWLAFLNKYRLHGILCDDMGLGKTLQTICMLASHHQNLAERGQTVQSLVVCPTTLGGHWLEEITKWVNIQHLNPFLYFGHPNSRASLRAEIPHHNVIITSYEIVRSDVDFLGSIKWNYLVLDEGHVIKNTKTKTSRAIRQLVAAHRLILTGTPIQNGVNELWALFDFLMPGYLGTEKQFIAKYSRPIVNSRDAKSSGSEQEAGALAMESLHRQTLPFILRRVKEDVLSDLPPKITQDYYCDLSPVQTELYEDFARSQAEAGQEGSSTSPTHVFQALQYLKKVCNHPRLVLTKDHPSYDTIVANQLGGNIDNLIQIEHAAKLTALKQLLVDLGIASSEETESVVAQHRALIFCQLKTMLDIVETDLLRAHLPSVSYLRLDGSVPANQRHSIVSQFNRDPSIDLLLLSTSVGGLGLNLTGADTVIFIEHDWNPMKDLQAMDRAHRIGQKKVVNVYRLITRNTLEEKIMSLQQFKIHTARTVISSDNTSIASMQTDQVLDLFSLSPHQAGPGKPASSSSGGGGVKSVLENLPELWGEEQYAEEYNMDNFIKNLK